LVFNFVEKPFIAKLEITGYKNREDEINFLFQTMGLQKGTMYTPQKIESAKKQLLVNLEREGYIHSIVEIDVETLSDTSVKVTFNVNKGMEVIIDKISYKGLKAFDISEVESVIANKEEDCCFTWFFGRHNGEMNFPVLIADGVQVVICIKIENFLPFARTFSGEQVCLVITIKMDLEGLAVGRVCPFSSFSLLSVYKILNR